MEMTNKDIFKYLAYNFTASLCAVSLFYFIVELFPFIFEIFKTVPFFNDFYSVLSLGPTFAVLAFPSSLLCLFILSLFTELPVKMICQKYGFEIEKRFLFRLVFHLLFSILYVYFISMSALIFFEMIGFRGFH